MTDLGFLKQFLGLEMEKYERGIMISQNKYDSNLIINFKMVYFKESKCPFISGIKLGEFGDSALVDFSLYMQLVCSLLYITHIRPDLEYDFGAVEIYMQKKHEIHWKS